MHDLATLKKRVQACFEAGALSTGCKLETRWISDYLDLKTNWPMAQAFEKNFEALGRKLTPLSSVPPGFAGSTDMGNVSHRVPSIHPMIGVAPKDVIIHNAEFARWAASDKGDAAVLDGAKSLAHTVLDLMCDTELMKRVRTEFAATAELSKSALAALTEKVPKSHPDVYAHSGCGCA
jgi:metal-dependent amidase/aminoacylase/carboxypeptidase family protein